MQAVLANSAPAPDVTFGQIRDCLYTHSWVIDAEPFVMGRVRALFKNGRAGEKGERTHSVEIVPKTADVAKDLLWLNERYPMEIPPDVWKVLQKFSVQYDNAIAAAATADQDRNYRPSSTALVMAEPPRPHQAGFYNFIRKVKRTLLPDPIGKGKTVSGITMLCEADARPAMVVCPPHLCKQWQDQVKRFLPDAKTHIIKGTKTYQLPEADVYITGFNRLSYWQDMLVRIGAKVDQPTEAPIIKTIIGDEIQDLRHTGTAKRIAFRALSEQAEYCAGLTATPIYNYGSEIWSVIDAIQPHALGTEGDFKREWCTGDKVTKPLELNAYLRSRGLMLWRDFPREKGAAKEVITLEGDLEALKQVEDVAKHLALSVLSNRVGESEKSAHQLDWQLRHATGVAKAKPVAEMVKMLCDSGEKVCLFGWHREVYDIWMKALKDYFPVLCTGTESPAQKEDSKAKFIHNSSCKVFICSLRSGAGIDGLQLASRIAVFGELDWSPQVMDQCIGRLDREGQTRDVQAYFPVIEDGADPFMMDVLGVKRDQHEGVVEGKEGTVEVITEGADSGRIRAMAEAYLAMIGESVPIAEPQSGLQAEVAAVLRKVKVPTATERDMQEALWSVLPGLLPGATVQREFRYGQRGRLDFLVTKDGESVAIECKIDQSGRSSVYRQVRRYAEEAGVTGLIVFAPWAGVSSFVVDEVPVTIVDWSKAKL